MNKFTVRRSAAIAGVACIMVAGVIALAQKKNDHSHEGPQQPWSIMTAVKCRHSLLREKTT